MNKESQQKKKSRYAKWIGAGLGWTFGGPIGGVLGFVFGSMIDGMQSGNYEYQTEGVQTRKGDFNVSLLVLAAAVMKADGQVVKSELDYVKRFLIRQFGEEEAAEQILLLRDILKQEIPLHEVCQQISNYMDYSTRLQLLHFLFGIAGADGTYHTKESDVIEAASRWMGISATDYKSVKAMFIRDTAGAFEILGIPTSATDEEVKKAYRAMAVLHHPDKVAHLGTDVQNAAKEKFQQINSAYEEIKRQRGLK